MSVGTTHPSATDSLLNVTHTQHCTFRSECQLAQHIPMGTRRILSRVAYQGVWRRKSFRAVQGWNHSGVWDGRSPQKPMKNC